VRIILLTLLALLATEVVAKEKGSFVCETKRIALLETINGVINFSENYTVKDYQELHNIEAWGEINYEYHETRDFFGIHGFGLVGLITDISNSKKAELFRFSDGFSIKGVSKPYFNSLRVTEDEIHAKLEGRLSQPASLNLFKYGAEKWHGVINVTWSSDSIFINDTIILDCKHSVNKIRHFTEKLFGY